MINSARRLPRICHSAMDGRLGRLQPAAEGQTCLVLSHFWTGAGSEEKEAARSMVQIMTAADAAYPGGLSMLDGGAFRGQCGSRGVDAICTMAPWRISIAVSYPCLPPRYRTLVPRHNPSPVFRPQTPLSIPTDLDPFSSQPAASAISSSIGTKRGSKPHLNSPVCLIPMLFLPVHILLDFGGRLASPTLSEQCWS